MFLLEPLAPRPLQVRCSPHYVSLYPMTATTNQSKESVSLWPIRDQHTSFTMRRVFISPSSSSVRTTYTERPSKILKNSWKFSWSDIWIFGRHYYLVWHSFRISDWDYILCHVLTRVLASGQYKLRYTARIAKASSSVSSRPGLENGSLNHPR